MLRTILYTRENSCPEAIKREFLEAGAKLKEIPMIQTIPLAYSFPQEKIDWIFFTSSNAVRFFQEKDRLSHYKIASIGNKTTETLQKLGVVIDFQPTQAVSFVMDHEWCSEQEKKQTVLIPTSAIANNGMNQTLKQCGHQVIEMPIYTTIFPKESKELLKQVFQKKVITDAIFASPSAWLNFKRIADEHQVNLEAWHFFSIGPVTTEAIRSSNEVVLVESPVYDMKHLYQEVLKEITRNGKL